MRSVKVEHAGGLALSGAPAGAVGEPDTMAGRAYRAIRYDIIRGRLEPNRRLRLEDLRERYAMGFSPIREALMQLHTEKLVVLENMKGFRVAPVSLSHLEDLTQVRIEVESLGLRWSIERGDAEWEAGILGAFHRLSKQKKRDADRPLDIDESWRAAHRAFHTALVAACGSPLLLSICTALFDQAERYVALSIRYLDEPRDDLAEHEALMDAALARNGARAMALCAQHIRRTSEKVAASPEMFAKSADRPKGSAR